MRRAALLFLPLLCACTLIAGCGQGESTYEFSDIRDRTKPRVVVPPTISTAQRFGLRDPRAMGGPGGDPHAGVPGMGGMPGARSKTFQWKTPTGWEEVKTSSSRDGSWRVKGEPQTDCSLSKLPGSGGGLLMNVNRWRKQMGAPEIDAAAVAALPRKTLLGTEAVYVDIPGRYGGSMGKGGPIDDARMLGFLLELPTGAVFLKFTGPAKVVEANQAQFAQLAASIQIAAHGGAGHANMPPPRRSSGRPEFTWTVPPTWEPRKDRGGRVITVAPKGSKGTECYLYLLSGDGGGIDLNINRWRQQMGQKALTAEEIAALERIDALGTKVVVVKIQGPYSGMGGEQIDGALLYGAVMLKDSYLLTAKMRGPASEVGDQWDNFIAFCKSVKQK